MGAGFRFLNRKSNDSAAPNTKRVEGSGTVGGDVFVSGICGSVSGNGDSGISDTTVGSNDGPPTG